MPPLAVEFDALILSGGRGSRLGGVSKGELEFEGRTLLSLALSAVAGAQNTVVVGHGDTRGAAIVVREDPPFGGPAAAIGAGLAALPAPAAHWVVVLGCDLPTVESALEVLFSGFPRVIPAGWDGVVGVDSDGIRQYVLGIYRRRALDAAVASQDVNNLSLRALVAGLDLSTVTIDDSLLVDIDTPADAAASGIVLPAPPGQISEAARVLRSPPIPQEQS